MPFTFQQMKIPDVILIEPKIYTDTRGYFTETYKRSEFIENGINENFVQDNWSHSMKGTLRGLHFQKQPKAQAKLVAMFNGERSDFGILREINTSLHRHIFDHFLVTEFLHLVLNVLQVFLGNVDTDSGRRFIEGFDYGYPIGFAIPGNGVKRHSLPEDGLQVR